MSSGSDVVGNKYYLELRLFGSFAAASPPTPLLFRSDKVRALLAYLVLHPAQAVSRVELSTLLYSEYPDQIGRKNLNLTLTRLRQSLAPVQNQMGEKFPLLTVERDYVRLNWQAEWHWADVLEFDALHTACQYHPHASLDHCAQCQPRLRRMVQLYTGDFLADLQFADAPTFNEWRLWQQETRLQQGMAALFSLAEGALAAANYAETILYARQQIRLVPWQERAHRQLIKALLNMGENAAARAQFKTLKQILAEKFRIEPGPETTALFDAALTPGTAPTQTNQSVHALSQLLLDPVNRLITLLPSPETDKTDLVQAISQRLAPQFSDGVWPIFLADCDPDNPENLVQTIAAALNIQLSTGQPSLLSPRYSPFCGRDACSSSWIPLPLSSNPLPRLMA